ncbi:rhamnogalacturonase B [Lasiosphaeris hirsuta]|uniref:rhamnogalacturonan endolyase n=1 Tax=Lasiosphaeris hirsuta TaxID=260670 RepID=A0AA40B1D6_9PEZI|nr:rhamnogalacturonase B [Lasiosphaeris hirsuta]
MGRAVDAAFGVTTKSNSFSVDTNAGLTFDVSKSNGDITNLLYKGMQYQGTSKMTQINSGLGTSKVTTDTINGHVRITVTGGSQPLTHYYVIKPDDPTIYMATYITGEISPGELRFLARLKRSAVPNGWHGDAANLDGCTAFEGKDTFKCPNGQTRCKMYTADRFIDDQVHGVTGNNVGIWLIMPGTAYETSSGGPFMRDINTQSGDDQELYWYMNSGHVRTEPWRYGLMGPYAMRFTTGAKPSANLDTSFFESLSIQGYVPASKRGSVSGTATGVANGFQAVLHWYNNASQYWAIADNSTGSYTSPLMKPGTYTMKLYRGEFPIAQDSVTVSAGAKTSKNIASTEASPSVVWRIGNFDGQPFELKNGDKIERMHPEDVRMGSWGGSYTVGKSSPKDFPMALFSKKGGDATVTFNVVANQAKAETTLRVGTTLSFKGGRPSVKIGSWTGKDPGAPKLIDSRGVTRGAYRGYGEVYTWKVPAGTLREGSNTLTLGVSGSGDANFLSANYIIDAVELQGLAGADSPRT